MANDWTVDTGRGFRGTFEVLSLSEWENSIAVYRSGDWVSLALVVMLRSLKIGALRPS